MDDVLRQRLSREELEQYDILLEEQAFPFEEKAIDIHLTNFKRIPQGTYDEPTKKSLKALGELMPRRRQLGPATQTIQQVVPVQEHLGVLFNTISGQHVKPVFQVCPLLVVHQLVAVSCHQLYRCCHLT